MAMLAASHGSTALQSLTVFFVLAVLVADVGGRHHVCHPFSCGALNNISYPFRRQGDPQHCGPYVPVCTATNATVSIGSGTYEVLSINRTTYYFQSYFWVVDTNLGMQSSCPLPRWDYHADRRSGVELFVPFGQAWATFVNCSQKINDRRYRPVHCMSTIDSFIYVLTGGHYTGSAQNFKPSCGYLATTPLGGSGTTLPQDASYEDVVKFMSKGFTISFPLRSDITSVRECLADSILEFSDEPMNTTGIEHLLLDVLKIERVYMFCIAPKLRSTDAVRSMLISTINIPMSNAIFVLHFVHVFCRFVLMPLAIFSFLACKYWKTRIAVDAVEKFLRMQQMLGGPMRYAYTDITAVTSHFREKLGQGGYGSVYKGVILPGNAQVAIKMLCNSKCNGDEFINEVSTIGRIHHVNVVRLMGFCSEETRRALIYEYMPNGSLDKYIFSSEKSFSWIKLNEIALGIARGLNYLHHGCDMQILHFDIKPHNILLDHNFVPKVADFGLAKLFPRDNSFVPLSAMRGTIGYIAPEMVSRSFGVISSKSDVYSFGMVLLEMAGGRRNADPNVANSSQNYYPSWVYDRLMEQQAGNISAADMHELEKKLCIIGLWCIQMKSHDRPTMSGVIEMLESDVNALEMPSRPFFCHGDEQIPTMDSYYLSAELGAIQEDDDSYYLSSKLDAIQEDDDE